MKIIILEDNRLHAQRIRRSLHRRGFSIRSVASPEIAYRILTEGLSPCILLLNSRLITMDSCSLLRVIKNLPLVQIILYADPKPASRDKRVPAQLAPLLTYFSNHYLKGSRSDPAA